MKILSANKIIKEIENIFPEPKTELANWEDDFQFLICVLLSAQTTDKQVNKVTRKLFKKFKNVQSFSASNIEGEISSINFYKTKARHIKGLSKKILKDFDGKIPKDVKKLVTLPGIGLKTANVFLNEMYRSNQGIPVDTHVFRVSRRLGLTKKNNPDMIAKDLEKFFLKKDWFKINTLFVLFGRYHCKAKNPKCNDCVFKDNCLFLHQSKRV